MAHPLLHKTALLHNTRAKRLMRKVFAQGAG
jgi:hypothetical protein